jgi:RecA/RadA recombinase
MSDLTDIKGLGAATEQTLQNNGVETLEDLAQAEPSELPISDKKARKFKNRAGQMTVIIDSGEEVAEEYESHGYVSTGVDLLDEALGGGWEESNLAALYGPSGNGKTQLVFTSMLEASKKGRVVYVETERKNYRPERLRQLSDGEANQSRIDRVKAFHSLDEQYNAYGAIVEQYDPDELQLVVVDSFTSQLRSTEEFNGRSNLGERANAIKSHLKEISRLLDEMNIPVIITGQVYESPEAYKKPKMWGSSQLEHEIGYFVRMDNAEGNLKQATVENHPAKPKKSVLLNIAKEGIESMGYSDD